MIVVASLWKKDFQNLFGNKFCKSIIILLLIKHPETVSVSLSFNRNNENRLIQKYVESNLFLGSWCRYVRNCIEEEEHVAKYNNYILDSICKLLIVELNHVLTSTSYPHNIKFNEVLGTSSNQQQDTIKDIQLRYMEHILDYQDEYHMTTNHTRPQRFAKERKVFT